MDRRAKDFAMDDRNAREDADSALLKRTSSRRLNLCAPLERTSLSLRFL